MAINRRRFLTASAAALLTPLNVVASPAAPRFASAAQDAPGNHWLLMFDQQGKVQLRHPLPARAHHVTGHPQHPWLMAVARRPGRFIDLVDQRTGALIRRIHSQPDRHFYGHAVFSKDGRWLAATENQIDSGEGRLVIRDIDNDFAIAADLPSHGIGPHELAWLSDQRTLVVANGGIRTHPDAGREKLNLDSMQPSLAYIDSQTGALLEQVTLPTRWHQCSIRHLDVNAQDEVAIALQYQGALHDTVPLIALHQRGQPLQPLSLPEPVRLKMKQYCGSARFDRSGEFFAISAPRGDLITFWRRDGQLLDTLRVRDGCGIAASNQAGSFVISSGTGRCYHYNLVQRKKTRLPDLPTPSVAWDNHMRRVG